VLLEKRTIQNCVSEQKNTVDSTSLDLSQKHFLKISKTVHQMCGISLHEGKKALVRFRLLKRLRALGMESFKEYIDFLEHDSSGKEIRSLIDVMTTNKTNFFREITHFNYLRENILPDLKVPHLRFWCAGCSSGEEPFSLAIVLREEIENIDIRDIKILATDVSLKMLEMVRQAYYSPEMLGDITPLLLQKYFIRVRSESTTLCQVKHEIRAMVRIGRLNLIEPWPMKGLFHVIFCRNVMIYFDRQTQQELINRFWEFLQTGGYLFLGHSESLSAISHNFKYMTPAVYRK
jgi:chemotaxis protein methyltransferase CheR